MKEFSRLARFFRHWMFRMSIFNRVLIGNSLVIIAGAVVGTFLTRHLALLGNLNLILLFSMGGILITLFVNYWIIKSALAPLYALHKSLDEVESGQTMLPRTLLEYEDPDIHHLVLAINSMLARLETHTQQLRAISEQAINAQEEERVRIARGLHDETAQTISFLIIRLEQMQKQVSPEDSALLKQINDASELSIHMLEDLRKVIWDLRPSILDDLGLIPAIRWYTRTKLDSVGIQVEFEAENETLRLPPHLETTLFRITQEAVSNILRHAGARIVFIRLHQADGHVCLDVNDDGCGFDVDRTADEAVANKKLGLLGIQERVSLVGGILKVESTPGLGTRLQIRVPLLEVKTKFEKSV